MRRTQDWLRNLTFVLLAASLTLSISPRLLACPFCSPPGPTLAEEMATAKVVLFAKLVERREAKPPQALPPAKFAITQVLKGGKELNGARQIEVLHVGDEPVGSLFYCIADEATEEPDVTTPVAKGLVWSQPIMIDDDAQRYLGKLFELPAQGAERLRFVLEFLEAEAPSLREDAYSEFAKAPYADVKDLKDHLRRETLLVAIENPYLDVRLRRLYLTLLGICGTNDDLTRLETWMKSDQPAMKASLDAIVACYLTLRGEAGLEQVECDVLRRPGVEFNDIYAAVLALRFHGEEERRIPRAKLAQTMASLLNRPQTAELVIADLARWQEWGSQEPLAKLFEQSTGDDAWIRVPIVQYFHACPEPKAKEQLAVFKEIDPQSVKLGTSPLPLARRPGESRLPPASREERD